VNKPTISAPDRVKNFEGCEESRLKIEIKQPHFSANVGIVEPLRKGGTSVAVAPPFR